MNKQKMINGLKDIEIKLLHYFNKNESKWLDVLDGDSRKYIDDYYDYSLKGYSGVTVKYLREYLFNKKYSKSMISYVLLKLLSEGKIQTLFCGDIKQIVFESTESSHGTHCFINNYDSDEEDYFVEEYSIENAKYNRYNSMIKSYYAISNYLNK